MSASCDKNQNLAVSSAGKLVKDLRVSELKTELEKRGIDSQGVKVVLTVRLNKALRQEGFDPEKYVFYAAMSKIKDQDEVSTVENSEGVKTDESMSSMDLQPSAPTVTDVDVAVVLEDSSQDLKIADESDDLGVVADQPKPESEILETEHQKTVKKEEPDEEVLQEQPKILKVEPVEPAENREEDVEGEDEFEEVAEEEVVPKPVTPGNDDIFLDEEDLLEDPLDEQPLEKRPESVDSTVPTIASTETSRAGTPAATSSGVVTDGFLFADDAKKTSIWIRGMEPATKASSVKQFVCQYGKVVQAKIFNSKPINGEIKNCFAFVTFADSVGMEAAMANLHRKEYQGRVLRCERVAESQLTGSAERIAKEKKDQEDLEKKRKDEEEEARKQQERKKRAQIQAPEDPNPKKKNAKKPERQTIQAPEKEVKKSSRAVIQAPAKNDRREEHQMRKDRKPIVYKLSPGAPAVLTTGDDRGRSSERDSRRTIAAPSSRRVISPLRTSSSRREQSLIISARVDTSGCRGGPAKRSVESYVPNSITTSQLRRNPIHVPANRQSPPPPRASYQTQQYTSSARDVRDARNVRDTRGRPTEEYRSAGASGDHRGHGNYHREAPPPQQHRHSSSSSTAPSRGDSRQEPRRGRGEDPRNQEPTPREREMLEMLRRKEEEHRLREEKLEMQKEREKMKFEAEKLERAKLELELTKQKLALQAALLTERGDSRAPASSSGGGSSGSSSRRRQADHFSPPSSARNPKVHTEDRRRSGGSGRTTSSIPSARHVAVAYGIQSSGNSASIGGSSSSRGASTNLYASTNNSTTKDYPYRSGGPSATSSSFDTPTTIGGYQNYSSGGYSTSGYQQQVWSGYDATGHVASGTNWTGTASASSSATTVTSQWPQQQQQYSSSGATSSSARHHHRDYNNYSGGRNNY